MNASSKAQLLEFIRFHGNCSPTFIASELQKSRQLIHRHLAELVKNGILVKIGKPPSVFYSINDQIEAKYDQKKVDSTFIDKNYLYIDPQGHLLWGWEGFESWAKKTGQAKFLETLANEFEKIRTDANYFFQKKIYIDATQKFEQTFNDHHLAQIFYSDFYSLPKFGKTILGTLVLYAKQAQDRKLIAKVVELIKPVILQIIKEKKIQAVAWAPHSIPRNIQFLKEVRAQLKLDLPEIELVKAYAGEVPIAQKSLSKLSERMENASKTILPKKSNPVSFQRILILDDAVGSGSTLAAMAQKISKIAPKSSVFGYAIVGSLKGFEVIKEV